jgi:hypothetical protein
VVFVVVVIAFDVLGLGSEFAVLNRLHPPLINTINKYYYSYQLKRINKLNIIVYYL